MGKVNSEENTKNYYIVKGNKVYFDYIRWKSWEITTAPTETQAGEVVLVDDLDKYKNNQLGDLLWYLYLGVYNDYFPKFPGKSIAPAVTLGLVIRMNELYINNKGEPVFQKDEPLEVPSHAVVGTMMKGKIPNTVVHPAQLVDAGRKIWDIDGIEALFPDPLDRIDMFSLLVAASTAAAMNALAGPIVSLAALGAMSALAVGKVRVTAMALGTKVSLSPALIQLEKYDLLFFDARTWQASMENDLWAVALGIIGPGGSGVGLVALRFEYEPGVEGDDAAESFHGFGAELAVFLGPPVTIGGSLFAAVPSKNYIWIGCTLGVATAGVEFSGSCVFSTNEVVSFCKEEYQKFIDKVKQKYSDLFVMSSFELFWNYIKFNPLVPPYFVQP